MVKNRPQTVIGAFPGRSLLSWSGFILTFFVSWCVLRPFFLLGQFLAQWPCSLQLKHPPERVLLLLLEFSVAPCTLCRVLTTYALFWVANAVPLCSACKDFFISPFDVYCWQLLQQCQGHSWPYWLARQIFQVMNWRRSWDTANQG